MICNQRRLDFVMNRILIGVFTVGLLTSSGWATHAHADLLLADVKTNDVWTTPKGTKLAMYQGGAKGKAELVFDRAALKGRSITLEIRGDAAGYTLGAGKARLDLRVKPTSRDRLVLSALNKSPKLMMNGSELKQFGEAWRWLLKQKESKTISLSFNSAKNVTVEALNEKGVGIVLAKRKPGVDLPDRVLKSDPLPKTSARGVRPKTETDAMLIQSQRGVFQLRVKTPRKDIYTIGTAFLISKDGFAISSFGVLKGAVGAEALIGVKKKAVPVELWAVKPTLNLALIKLDMSKIPVGEKVHPFELVEDDPSGGAEVWALGFNRYGEPTVTAGNVSKLLAYTKLDEGVRKALNYSNLSHWVNVTCEVNVNNSGGPIVNADGQIVAMATWVWPSSSSRTSYGRPSAIYIRGSSLSRRSSVSSTGKYYGLNAVHLEGLINPPPTSPLTFARARTRYGTARVSNTSLPRVQVKRKTPTQLRLLANTFRKQAICPLCKGEGEIVDVAAMNKEKEKKRREGNAESDIKKPRNRGGRANRNGNRNEGAASSRGESDQRDDETIMKTCPRCKGNGFNFPDAVFRMGGNVVSALAGLDHDDPKVQSALVHLHEKIFEITEHNPQRLVRALNVAARKHLHRASLVVGTPVLFVGLPDKNSGLPGNTRELTRVRLGATGKSILVAEPDVADTRIEGVAFVGGILAGYLDDEHGTPVPLIHRGFIINIPADAISKYSDGKSSEGSNTSRNATDAARARADAWRRWMESRRSYYDRSRSTRSGR